ncbi:helix-turn-helix domain-containing protein [Oscillospiraceae bacterium LTW-04]|nr:helix-turn-helix transcriptional regulator [Oscillospiraceae bacterium MB24-C1]
MKLHELIKAIRLEMELSQQQLAKELLVSFAAVNRWENQHTKPNKIARNALIQLAKKCTVSDELIKAFEDAK